MGQLTPGSQSRPEWADPMGYIANTYGTMRVPGAVLPEAPARVRPKKKPPAPQERKRGRREEREAVITPAIEDLEGIRQRLASDLREAARAGSTLEVFDLLADRAEAFVAKVGEIYSAFPYLNAKEDIGVVRDCVNLLRQAGGAGAHLEHAQRNFQWVAEILADDLIAPLSPVE